MRILRFCLASILIVIGVYDVFSQEIRRESRVGFRVNKIHIDPSFRKNAEGVKELKAYLDEVAQDTTIELTTISFRGVASPEGSDEWNRYLAKNRMAAIEKIVRSKIELPDSVIRRDASHISWSDLRECVEASNMPYKQEVLDIIDGESRLVPYYNGRHIDKRVVDLRRLRGGKVWKQLFRNYFADLRYAKVVTASSYKPLLPFASASLPPYLTSVAPPTAGLPMRNFDDMWIPQLHLKTNALGWALLMTNLAIEVDITRHLSFHLPVYYSAWNYFTETLKFRTFGFYPELRAWFNKDNEKWFLGAHFGFAYYNFAFNGDLRYQDHYMKTPAMGGGISVGYRMPISRDHRWKVEFAIGAGVYPLHYDTFHNEHNGQLIESFKKTYWGIDQASVSFSYSFDLKKRGGAR